jgi:hypothetical protein
MGFQILRGEGIRRGIDQMGFQLLRGEGIRRGIEKMGSYKWDSHLMMVMNIW